MHSELAGLQLDPKPVVPVVGTVVDFAYGQPAVFDSLEAFVVVLVVPVVDIVVLVVLAVDIVVVVLVVLAVDIAVVVLVAVCIVVEAGIFVVVVAAADVLPVHFQQRP